MILSVQNVSTVVGDQDGAKYVAALQKQIGQFCQHWPVAGAALAYVPKGSKPKKGDWVLAILDNPDQAGALGYHDVTSEDLPLGKVFAKLDLQAGYSVSVTMSHELLEMLVDPFCCLTSIAQDVHGRNNAYAYEACDACEDDQFGYQIDGVLVSDFVLPTWFTPGMPGPFDFGKKITQALGLLPGGYIGVLPIRKSGQWTQLTAAKYPGQRFLHQPGSRREKRIRHHENGGHRVRSAFGLR